MAPGAVAHQSATSGVRRNMPDSIPVMVLARLAVDHRAQGIQLGAGVRALLVHALNEQAKQFYAHYGFQESPLHPMTLLLGLNTVSA